MPISFNFFLNRPLSSVLWIASIEGPNTSTLYFFNTPFKDNSRPVFKAVCPPNPSNMPSGFSFSIIFSTK